MKIELTGDVYLYEFDNKHFVIGGDSIYQLDNALNKQLHLPNSLVVCEVDDGFKHHDNQYTHNLYFEKSSKLIIHIYQLEYNHCKVMNSDFELQFSCVRFEGLFTIGTDVYILAHGGCYKNMKKEVNYAFMKNYFNNRHRNDFGQNDYHNIEAISDYRSIQPLNHVPGYSVTTEGIYDVVKHQKVPEVLFGIVKGHEFIKKWDRFFIKESTIVSKKSIDTIDIKPIDTIDIKPIDIIIRSNVIKQIREMDESKLYVLFEALGKWT